MVFRAPARRYTSCFRVFSHADIPLLDPLRPLVVGGNCVVLVGVVVVVVEASSSQPDSPVACRVAAVQILRRGLPSDLFIVLGVCRSLLCSPFYMGAVQGPRSFPGLMHKGCFLFLFLP